jgi:hypothetical protein
LGWGRCRWCFGEHSFHENAAEEQDSDDKGADMDSAGATDEGLLASGPSPVAVKRRSRRREDKDAGDGGQREQKKKERQREPKAARLEIPLAVT